MVHHTARWSSGLRLRPLTPATRVRISYGSPKPVRQAPGRLFFCGRSPQPLFCIAAQMEDFRFVAALGFVLKFTPVAARPRASLSLPRESDKERPGSPPGPRAGRQPSSGGCRPGLPLDSRPNPGLHWPPGRIGAPCAAGPGRGASAQPVRCSRRNLG